MKPDGNYELTDKRNPTNLKQKKHEETYTKVQQSKTLKSSDKKKILKALKKNDLLHCNRK